MSNTIQKETIWQALAFSIFTTCLVTACSSSDDSGSGVVNTVPSLKLTEVSDAPLAKSTTIDAGQYVRNGIYLMQTQSVYVAPDAGGDAAAQPLASESFSRTNTQIEGVDEADRIEYNGDFLFVADLPVWTEENGEEKNVRVYQRLADATLVEAAAMPLDTNFNVAGMYLNDDALGVVSHAYQYHLLDTALVADSPWHQTDNDTIVNLYDVSTPTEPVIDADIRIDGGLISSRRIDDMLYVAIQFVPYLDDLPAFGADDASLLNIYNAILQTDDSALVPQISINGQVSNLYDVDDCLLPETSTSLNGHPQMVSVVQIDMNNPSNYSAVCMLTEAHGLFMSQNNVYLHAGFDGKTAFHKVSLGDDMQYQASGSVSGEFSWRSSAQFKMAERQDKFLAVTTDDLFSGDPEHHLYVLEQQGNELVSVAQLPNETQPAPIGKPGEDIYAVRFFEDKAYIVTFERIDPLYVIDLTDVTAPSIQGELEIPGFSSYLHPMENGLLLGVGQQVNGGELPTTGDEPLNTPVVEGMKVSLFDVQDPANPVVLNEFVYPSGFTPVEYDHRALSVLNTDEGYRFVFPMESWASFDEQWQYRVSFETLDVSETDRSLNQVRSIVPAVTDDFYYGSYENRSVIDGDNLYLLRGNEVFHTQWQSGTAINGPY